MTAMTSYSGLRFKAGARKDDAQLQLYSAQNVVLLIVVVYLDSVLHTNLENIHQQTRIYFPHLPASAQWSLLIRSIFAFRIVCIYKITKVAGISQLESPKL